VTQEDFEARILSMPAKFGNIAKVLVDRTAIDGGETTIDVNVLSYNNNKNLVTLPPNSDTVHPIKTNLKNYLDNYRMITDEIQIIDGKIINFGVVFDVVAHRSVNKSDVKLRCINSIINYFNIDKMQFRQPIFLSDLEYELMGLDGVRSVNFVRLGQGHSSTDFLDELNPNEDRPLYDFNVSNPDTAIYDGEYGFQYDFSQFYGDNSISSDGIVLPSQTPAVFELKNPRENVKGVVR
tara:strand:- start:21 stop:731 length:711 start_codon:yes stop_codon:yes gene_type:complete